jgi:hypothetical protein
MARKKRHNSKVEPMLFPPSPESTAGQHYYYVTQRPWPSLLFVLPMLLVFELGTYFRQGTMGGATSQLVATFLIEKMVAVFGSSGFFFPGLVTIAILLAIHIVGKHPWKFDPFVLPGMLGESLLWTLPLLVFNRVLHTAVLAGGKIQDQWIDEVICSFGAGLYEELIFRLICITVLVIVLIDVCKLPRTAAGIFIMMVSAVLFAAQHHPPLGTQPFILSDFLFRIAAGLFLAGLFAFRGFGIAAGCHSFYNVIVVTIGTIQS